jgi:glycosyltransferase involved in cell wall biosynthesis
MSKHPVTQSLDIFHGLSHELPKGLPSSVKKVVTVHDLIFFRYPEFYNSIDVLIYKAKVRSACQQADIIIAISDQTAQDIVEFLKIDLSKIRIVYQGSHPQFSRHTTGEERKQVKEKYNLPNNYILNVGTIERRKNIKVVVEAMARMPAEKRIPLVIIGKPTTYYTEVMKLVATLKLQDWIHIKSDVAFSDFPAIYQSAKVFVYPSLFEGFGIPIVEAIHSRVPVITSIGSCFEEAGGPATRYVNPLDSDQMSVVLEEILNNDTLIKSIVEQSEKHVLQFSQQEVSRHLMDIYNEIV